MKAPFFWITDTRDWPKGLGPISMTIGNFDGVHLGHQKLLETSLNWAQAHQGTSVILTFSPHPIQALFPEKKFTRLFDLEDQKKQFLQRGVGGVFLQAFSREFSEISAQNFLSEFLYKNFHPTHLVVGYDFSFGKDRNGNSSMLAEFCNQKKIEFEQVPAFHIEGEIVSSSIIRKFLENGEPQQAAKFLGRPYYLKGIVEKGDQRGQALGFPTANIRPQVDFFPKMGVYASRTYVRGEVFNSVTNIGLNLTFLKGEASSIKVETHVLDFNKNIYGEEIQVELLYYLRPEMRFSGIDELKLQITSDIKKAKGFF